MPSLEPNRALARAKLETLAWQVTPADYRGGSGSRRSVLMNSSDGTTSVELSTLTDNQLRKYIGPRALEEAGDMQRNGRVTRGPLSKSSNPAMDNFAEDVLAYLSDQALKRTTRFSGGDDQLFVNFYNVPESVTDGTTRENNRAGLTVTGFARGGGRLKCEVLVRFTGDDPFDQSARERFKLRTKTASEKAIAQYVADYINLCAEVTPKSLSPNARREEPDEQAARELSLFIENDYDLVGAPNSQGKAIEKNLLSKIRKGTFDLELSEQAWMYLMETGAKKYAKEFASPGDWAKIFNKPTRELVAHEFATSFFEEHGKR